MNRKALFARSKQETGMTKRSKPIKVGTAWRILRHDGELVGWYMTKEQAQRAIDKQPWLE